MVTTLRDRWQKTAGTVRRSLLEWVPSPEITRVRMPLHLLLRSCVLTWSTFHEDGPLRGRLGRRVALGVALTDLAQAALLGSGRLDAPGGRVLRSALDSAEVAALVLAYPAGGKDAGMAAALLPATGVAVEQIYLTNPLNAAAALTAPTLAGYMCRRLTHRPTSFADIFTYPLLAVSSSLTMRVVEQASRERMEAREARRRETELDASYFLGWRQMLEKQRVVLALDEIQRQFSDLLTSTAPRDRSRSQFDNAQELRVLANAAKFLSPRFNPEKPAPSLLAIAFQHYELNFTNSTNVLKERVFLEKDVPAFTATTEHGRTLLNENQVAALRAALDGARVTGPLHAEVLEWHEQAAGHDLLLRISVDAPDGSIETFEIPLPCTRSPWQLELVTAGLLIQSVWRLSVSSPGHAHVPLRVTLGSVAADILAARLAETIARRGRGVNKADLAALCLPGSLLIATAGTRAMRRKTYNPGGTPMHPGLHVLAGNGYLLGSQLGKMSPRAQATVAAGVSAQIAASWYCNRREPGDLPAFVVELVRSVLAWMGSLSLAHAVSRMAECVNREQNSKMANASSTQYVSGWEGCYEEIAKANSAARSLLFAALEASGEPIGGDALNGKAADILERNKFVDSVLADARADRPNPERALYGPARQQEA